MFPHSAGRKLEFSMRPKLAHLAAKLALAVFAGLTIGCHRAGAPVDEPQRTPGVAMRNITFFSPALNHKMTYRVFLPEKVDPRSKLPVIYLLHGNGGDFTDWSNHSNVSQYAARGLILVMPEGHSSYFMNAVEKSKDRYEDYVVQDLIRDVETRFPAATDRSHRAIAGVSMGGFAAVKIALSYPSEFVFAGAISPAIDVAERRFSWKRIRQWAGFREIFGPVDSAERRSRDPFLLVQSVDPKTAPYFYLTAGQQEPLREPIQRFAGRLNQRGFQYEFHAKPGGHDWTEWDTQISGCFERMLATIQSAQTR